MIRGLNTRARIVLLVVAAALPALGLTIYNAFDTRAKAQRDAQTNLLLLTRFAAIQQQEMINGVKQILAGSSVMVASIKDDRQRCNDFMKTLVAVDPGLYTTIGVIDGDGILRCNAVPWKGEVSAKDRPYIQRALQTGEFAISEFRIGNITKKPAVSFAYPISAADGSIIGVSFAALDLASFKKIADATPLPPGGRIFVTDRDGIILARYPYDADAAKRIGKKFALENILSAMLANEEGAMVSTDPEGSQRLLAYKAVGKNPDGGAPFHLGVSVPVDTIYSAADQRLIKDLIALGIATCLLLIGAWIGAERFVLRSIRLLRTATSGICEGDLSARTGLTAHDDELTQLGRAFDEMANRLQQRDGELKHALHELQQQAITDPLTGLFNRRYLQDLLPREVARTARSHVTLAIVMLDVDHFKKINDRRGHPAGDIVLKALGSLLENSIRAGDTACRYGGEEFIIVLPDTTEGGALHKAQLIRETIKRLHLEYDGKPLGKITASLGVAIFPHHALDADSLVQAADHALYEAKGTGRDRVVASSRKAAANLKQIDARRNVAEIGNYR